MYFRQTSAKRADKLGRTHRKSSSSPAVKIQVEKNANKTHTDCSISPQKANAGVRFVFSKSLHSIWLLSLCHSRTEISRDFSFCIYFQGIRSTLCLTHLFSLGRLMESEVVKQEIQFAIKEFGHKGTNRMPRVPNSTQQSPGHGAYVSLIQQSGFWAWEKDRLLKTNNQLPATHF